MTEYNEEEVWEHFFQKLVADDDGTISIDKLKQELMGYFYLLNQSAFVYAAITGNRITSSNHSAMEVLDASVEFFNQMTEYIRIKDQARIDELTEMNTKLLEQLYSVD